MVNARQAALYDRRSTTKRKVLRPGSLSSAADSIARKMADATFESMVKRYSDGAVSNEEMYSYLQSSMSNPYFTDMDKVNIEDKLRDFESAVIGERLQAEFESSTGQDKIGAAQQLAAYYNDRANNLEANTPAQSKAMQAVAEWKGKAEKVYSDIKKDERKLARAEAEFELSQLPPGLENLQKQAEAYRKLAEQAQQDGENIDALEWASKSNEILTTKLPAAREKEARDEIDDRLDLVKSNYERGAISADDAVAELNQIDQSAQENGLYDVLPTIDAFTEKLGLDVQKGTTIEEFEGRTFRVRMPSGGELNATIKDMKAVFQEEDDMLRSMFYEIEQDPEILSQYGAKSMLYNAYINGGDLGDGIEFYGLKNRKAAYESWAEAAPDKAYVYENAARDLENKINQNLDKLSEMIYALDSIAGDDPAVQQLVQDVTGAFEQGQINTFDGGGEMGILVTTDKYGRQVQKTIPLNSSVQTTDAAGNNVINDTYVGTNVALVPGTTNTYVKLSPVYLSEEQRAQGFAMYSTAEYNGQIFVKTLSGTDIVPAQELAATDQTFNEWYTTPDANTGQSMADYAVQLQQRYVEANPPGTEPIQEGQLPPEAGDVTQDLSLRDPNKVNLDDPSLTDLNAPRGTGQQIDFGRVNNNYDFNTNYLDNNYLKPSNYNINQATGSFNTPTTNFASNLLQPLPGPNALQSSGLKINLDESYAPINNTFKGDYSSLAKSLPSTQPKQSFFSKAADTVKSGVSSVGNWLKNLNPFN